MKVLVLGGFGMAGHMIASYLAEKGHYVEILARSNRVIDLGCKVIECDIQNFEHLRNIIHNGEYNAIINAVGVLNKNADNNKEIAVLINSYLPHFLVKETMNLTTKIIQMSTDCVFSGKRGQYKEYDFKDGETFYDRTKALGEIDDTKNITFRCSIVGPDINVNGIGLFNWFMKQSQEVTGYTMSIWTGVTTLVLAQAMEQAILQDLSGIYNLVNNTSISKYEMLVLFNKYSKHDALNVLAVEGIKQDKSLINTREDFSFNVPSYDQMFSEMADWINNHKNLYKY